MLIVSLRLMHLHTIIVKLLLLSKLFHFIHHFKEISLLISLLLRSIIGSKNVIIIQWIILLNILIIIKVRIIMIMIVNYLFLICLILKIFTYLRYLR